MEGESEVRTGERVVGLVAGAVLAGCGGVVVYLVPGGDVAGLACGGVLMLVGLEAMVSGVRGRRSWLSRVGPLP